jgi:2-methylcitrate dehydratase
MDATTSQIASYAATLAYADLSADVVHECKRHLLDTVGCALGAFDEPPSRIARTLAERVNVPGGARVLGTGQRALPELAAFANGVMARYLDGNDVFPGGGGHPSDVISAVLAAADLAGADGPGVITGVVLGYEIYGTLFRAACMRDHGLDHVFYTAVGSAIGAAKVLGLDRDRIAQAVALSVTPNIALHATRRGELSMWKGAAAGNAARNGVFAALLAAAGMTGPDKPIDGSDGLRELLGTFELGEFGGNGRPFQLPRADFKYFLSEFHSQSPITAAIELRQQIAAEDIESVTVHTYHFTWSEIGTGPEKWRPTTRESADHSLPYILAAVLIDGRFSDDIFSESRIRDARAHEMASRIAIKEDKDYSRQFPGKIPCRIEIRAKSGKALTAQVDYPRGHTSNPMTDEEVWAKFRMLAGRKLPKAQVEQALEIMWAFEAAKGLDSLFESVRIGGTAANDCRSFLRYLSCSS